MKIHHTKKITCINAGPLKDLTAISTVRPLRVTLSEMYIWLEKNVPNSDFSVLIIVFVKLDTNSLIL